MKIFNTVVNCKPQKYLLNNQTINKASSLVTNLKRESCDKIDISTESILRHKQNMEDIMAINDVSSSAYHNSQLDRNTHAKNKNSGQKIFDDYFQDISKTQTDLQDSSSKHATCKMFFNDPWPSDFRLRDEGDKFLDMLKRAYDEVLIEKDYSFTNKNEETELRRAAVKKLSNNQEAVQLMTILHIDLTSDDLSNGSIKTAEQIRNDLDLTKNGGYIPLELRERIIYEELGEEGYREYMNFQNTESSRIPGLTDYAWPLVNPKTHEPNTLGDIIRFIRLKRTCRC